MNILKLSQVFLEVHTTTPLEMEQKELSTVSAFSRSVKFYFCQLHHYLDVFCFK